MKTVFNLKKYIKTAFYEDDRGYWNKQTRSWMNCYKCKSDKGIAPQKAWDECLSEYQQANDKAEWVLSYTGVTDDIPKERPSAKTPAAQKILK
jgi:hypothetical protein